LYFFFQAEDGIRDSSVTGVQTCALPICMSTTVSANPSDARTGLTLALPALMLFTGVVVIPLAMTVLLSFHDWGQYKGIEPVFIQIGRASCRERGCMQRADGRL